MYDYVVFPEIAVKYWKLAPDAVMRDVVLAVRKVFLIHNLAMCVQRQLLGSSVNDPIFFNITGRTRRTTGS